MYPKVRIDARKHFHRMIEVSRHVNFVKFVYMGVQSKGLKTRENGDAAAITAIVIDQSRFRLLVVWDIYSPLLVSLLS